MADKQIHPKPQKNLLKKKLRDLFFAVGSFFAGWGWSAIVVSDKILPYIFVLGIIIIWLYLITDNVISEIFHTKITKKWVRTMVSLFVLVSCCVLAFSWASTSINKQEEEKASIPVYNGSLYPGNGPVPEPTRLLLELNNVPSDDIVLMMGNYSFAYFSKINDKYILAGSQKPFIEIGKKPNGSITISTTIIDSHNNKVAKIINNEFVVSPEFSFNPIRPNYHTLIVRDMDGNEVLNMDYVNERTIRITGQFLAEGQRLPVIIDSEGMITYEGEGLSRMIMRDTGRGVIWFKDIPKELK